MYIFMIWCVSIYIYIDTYTTLNEIYKFIEFQCCGKFRNK